MNQYYSQYGQDRILYKRYFKDLNKGFFLEVGADDGIDKSNTKFFEDKGWEGICIEPSPERFQQLIKNRKCLCLNNAIAKNKQLVDFIDIIGYGKGLSGIIDNYDPRHLERIDRETTGNEKTLSKKKIKVEAIPLSEILHNNNVSKVDYCSIDVEGSELDVLESIDFDSVDIRVFTIEDNYNSKNVKSFLGNKNYKIVRKIGPDLLCIKKKRLFSFFS